MASRFYRYVDGRLVELSEVVRAYRSDAPNIIGDSMSPIHSHADDKFYDSKSAYRQMLKREGFVELGNDRIREKRKPCSTAKLREALNRLPGW